MNIAQTLSELRSNPASLSDAAHKAKLRTGRQLVRLAHDGALEQAFAKRAETDQQRQDYALLASFIHKLAAPPNVKKVIQPTGRAPREGDNARSTGSRRSATSTSSSSQDPGDPELSTCARRGCVGTFKPNEQGRPRKYCGKAACEAARLAERKSSERAVAYNTLTRVGTMSDPLPERPKRRTISREDSPGRWDEITRAWRGAMGRGEANRNGYLFAVERLMRQSERSVRSIHRSAGTPVGQLSVARPNRIDKWTDSDGKERSIIWEDDNSPGQQWLQGDEEKKAEREEKKAKAKKAKAKKKLTAGDKAQIRKEAEVWAKEKKAEAEEKAWADHNRARRDCGLPDASRGQRAPKNTAEATPRNIPATPKRRNKATA